MTTVSISRQGYEQMLRDEGIAVMCEERRALKERNALLESEIKQNTRKIVALTSTIAALQLMEVR